MLLLWADSTKKMAKKSLSHASEVQEQQFQALWPKSNVVKKVMWWEEKIGRSFNTLDSFPLPIPFTLQHPGCEGESSILGAGAVWDVCHPGAVPGVSCGTGQSQQELVLCACGAFPGVWGRCWCEMPAAALLCRCISVEFSESFWAVKQGC